MGIDEYLAFGEEWVKEVMKLRKKDLIEQYKRVCLENQKLKKEIQEAKKGNYKNA